MNNYRTAILKSGKDRPILRGHPWIFSGAIKFIDPDAQPGDFLIVKNNSGKKLGLGYYNPKSQISIRMLSHDPDELIDATFVNRRVRESVQRREIFFKEENTDCYRLIYAEADGLPGVIVDKYAQYLVLQCHTLGAENMKGLIVDALSEVLKPEGILERSNIAVRRHEGLDEGNVGLLTGNDVPTDHVILENGFRFAVDIMGGQKTGFFLDQRNNRKLVKQISADKEVLNLYAYTGATSVAALAGGARSVVSVDTDKQALELSDNNITLNNLSSDSHEKIASDVTELLKNYRQQERVFDLVVLDPPAFAKHRGALRNAMRAYLEVNSRVMSLLRSEGFLLTSSCSGLIKEDMFREMLINAARDASVRIVTLGEYPQPLDHPLLPAFQEGRYLKTSLVQVLKR